MPGGLGHRRRSAGVALLATLLLALSLAACGGNENGDSGDGAAPVATSQDEGEDDAATETVDVGGASGTALAGSATVMLGTETYEFSESSGCRIDDSLVTVTFEDRGDYAGITVAGDTILVRLRVDGAEWVDTGSPPSPDISGTSLTWSGELQNEAAGAAAATFDVSC